MAQDPVSTSIFHKYLLTDNTVGLCHVQITLITDPTPLNSTNSTYIVGTLAKAWGTLKTSFVENCLSQKMRRNEKCWKEVTREEKKGRKRKRGQEWTIVGGEYWKWWKESRQQRGLGRQKVEMARGNLWGSFSRLRAGCNSKSEWGLAHVILGRAKASEL